MDKEKEKLRNLRKYAKKRKVNTENGCRYVIGTLKSRELRINGLKYCPKCKETKKLKDFNKSKNTNKGYSSYCTLCSRELGKKYYNPEYGKKRYEKTRDSIRNNNLKNKFGITLDDYNNKLKNQEGKCMICNINMEQTGKNLAVDHNHSTGEVRDLLCGNCNAAIGFLQENVEIAKKAVEYLMRWSK